MTPATLQVLKELSPLFLATVSVPTMPSPPLPPSCLARQGVEEEEKKKKAFWAVDGGTISLEKSLSDLLTELAGRSAD